MGEAEARLETQRVVQLCERIHHTDATGKIAFSKETFAKGFREQRLKEQWFHTGGAWAARREFLKKYDFDPVRDITIDSNGLWAWNSDKPGMHRDVAHYFKLRQEDGPEETQTHSQQPTLQNTPTPATPPPQRNVTRWSVGVTTAPRENPRWNAHYKA